MTPHPYFTHSPNLETQGALVFFMQAGFAMLCAGSVRRKNTQNTMLKVSPFSLPATISTGASLCVAVGSNTNGEH